MKLDLPELFVPARSVSGLTSNAISDAMDLKPDTDSFIIPSDAYMIGYDLCFTEADMGYRLRLTGYGIIGRPQ
ncbi:MAG: hypothetical protein LBJ00_06645 [Planctomycetaceae bacterium]|nr:hypothetical protein [Planctomycetaceae bacterium]